MRVWTIPILLKTRKYWRFNLAEKVVYNGIGRRKSSTARVCIIASGKGGISINGRPFQDYGCRPTLTTIIKQPLVAVDAENDYDIKVNVSGGGLTGQAGAIRLGISRALLNVNSTYRAILKSKGFLTRDSRRVERKKPGQPGARKKFQFSKR